MEGFTFLVEQLACSTAEGSGMYILIENFAGSVRFKKKLE